MIDILDREIINEFRSGLELIDQPYAAAAHRLGVSEATLIARLRALLARGLLTRFGPLYDAEAMGGGITLAAMHVPEQDFNHIAAMVDAYPEVAHNYKREHHLNMWFVVCAESPQGTARVLDEIEQFTGLRVYDMPKREEFHVGSGLET